MTETLNVRVEPATAYTPELLKAYVAPLLGVAADRIKRVDIRRRSIDARQRRVFVNLTVDVHVDGITPTVPYKLPDYADLAPDAPCAVVVGAGPAGLFAALRLIESGVKPVVLERGKDVDARRRDLAAISRTDVVDPDSNYAFGEGGAGAYSDGKLYTRSKKRGPVDKVLNILHAHGAPDDILVDAHPHIGTNLLPDIIKAIRETIRRHGGEVRFGERVTGLVRDADGVVSGVVTRDGKRYTGPVILATGHSARDVYAFLADSGIELEAKGIAVGVRLEHPQELIDRIQYHSPKGRGRYLPPAEYSHLTRVDDRAVYSFCMCPGGFIVPAASAPGELVVNGMSPSNRGTRWANSGMVVEVLPEDVEGEDALRMLRYQQSIERAFFVEAGGRQNAPAQRMTDFVAGRPSRDLPPTSYAPGIHPARIDLLLPEGISSRLRRGFEVFGRKSSGFLTDRATLIGAETRTSAPVRIPRETVTLVHRSVPGLYPAGEGAGYAGGIVSAAIDGDRVATALAATLADKPS